MPKSQKNNNMPERGTSHLVETVKRLEKRVAALEHARKHDGSWPEIIPLDNQARIIYEHGIADSKAGRMTPTFSSVEEMDAYFKSRRS
jgi:hypothetical protein